MKTVKFTPITITAETLQILAKEKNYADLIALYMAYVEITTWQNGNNIKATNSFMMKRLHWGEIRFTNAKKTLVDMSLVEAFQRKNDKGQTVGHYVLIKHVIQNPLKPQPPEIKGMDEEGTSTNDLQLSTNDSKSSDKSLTIKEKTKLDSDISFDADETKEPVPVVNGTTTPTTKKLFYDVCKKYGLFITNHNNVRKWANDMETMDDGMSYLRTLLDKDIRTMEGEFKPTLNTPFDIVSKKLKIQRFLNGGESAKPYDPRVGSF